MTAQILASLNHPNIAAIHGIEESEGTRALVLELVEGQTLADRGPQVLRPALNAYEHLIEMPRVSLAAASAPQSSSVLEPEGEAPLSDCLVRNADPRSANRSSTSRTLRLNL